MGSISSSSGVQTPGPKSTTQADSDADRVSEFQRAYQAQVRELDKGDFDRKRDRDRTHMKKGSKRESELSVAPWWAQIRYREQGSVLANRPRALDVTVGSAPAASRQVIHAMVDVSAREFGLSELKAHRTTGDADTAGRSAHAISTNWGSDGTVDRHQKDALPHAPARFDSATSRTTAHAVVDHLPRVNTPRHASHAGFQPEGKPLIENRPPASSSPARLNRRDFHDMPQGLIGQAKDLEARQVVTSRPAPHAPPTHARTSSMSYPEPVPKSEFDGTEVRYSFKSWDGRPTVALRFDASETLNVVTAKPSHDEVQHAMEHRIDQLAPGVAVEFEREGGDGHGGDQQSGYTQHDQEAEE
ncbi:SpaN/EivJ family type III secretion system needle length determinant [Burkholderia ubonensis]|uniref:SpaN/EivJ family type III secretion system needle length determinant n=1 Tax=Burkholderia ubonensis TaxID=101571 RepID=UPI000A4EC1D5|nr:hypothetical protein [Burkholderia ubonensis]